MKRDFEYGTLQAVFLILLRTAIGWHFLYEGLSKLFMGNWSSASFLEVSSWIFAPIFRGIAARPALLAVVDQLNIWGLMLIGSALMLGLFVRLAAGAGMFLLLLYYLAVPPLVGHGFGVPQEGHYLVVNKNLVEFFALAVLLVFPTGRLIGLGALLPLRRKKSPGETRLSEQPLSFSRRRVLKALATTPALGAFAYAFIKKMQWQSWEERNLADAMTSPSTKLFNPADIRQLRGRLPKAKIKGTEFSRLILGGNLLSGWAHSRDLIYVSQLVKAYHNKDKIFATLLTAERCGIDTLLHGVPLEPRHSIAGMPAV